MPRITKRLVDATEAQPAEYFVWDSEIPGFGLRVLPLEFLRWRAPLKSPISLGAGASVLRAQLSHFEVRVVGGAPTLMLDPDGVAGPAPDEEVDPEVCLERADPLPDRGRRDTEPRGRALQRSGPQRHVERLKRLEMRDRDHAGILKLFFSSAKKLWFVFIGRFGEGVRAVLRRAASNGCGQWRHSNGT